MVSLFSISLIVSVAVCNLILIVVELVVVMIVANVVNAVMNVNVVEFVWIAVKILLNVAVVAVTVNRVVDVVVKMEAPAQHLVKFSSFWPGPFL